LGVEEGYTGIELTERQAPDPMAFARTLAFIGYALEMREELPQTESAGRRRRNG